MLGDVLGGFALPLFSSLSNITSVTSSAATSRVDEIMGEGGAQGVVGWAL